MKVTSNWTSQPWLAALALLMIFLAGCGRQDPARQAVEKRVAARFLAAGEKETVGFYQLNNVLLPAGQLIWLDPEDATAMGIGDTLKQAQEKGVLTPAQGATLQQKECTLRVLPDHTFTLSNLPAASFSQSVSFQGTWSLKVYHVFDAARYRLSMIGGPKGDLVLSKFYNADLPGIIEIQYREGPNNQVSFRFKPSDPTEAGIGAAQR